MLPRFCKDCSKWFFCKIIFNRHNKKFHSTLIQSHVDNSIRLSDGTSDVGISQTNFDLDLSGDEYNLKRSYRFGFWQLEMCEQMKKWSVNKFKKNCPVSVFQPHTYI